MPVAEFKPRIWDILDIPAGLRCAAEGGKVKDIAKALGCHVDTLRVLRDKDASFATRLKRAREQGFEYLADQMLSLHEDYPDADWNELRLRFETTKWYLSKMHAAVFGDKLALQVEHVDIRGALEEARSRVPRLVNPVLLPPVVDPFER